jgi:hypothetical protein
MSLDLKKDKTQSRWKQVLKGNVTYQLNKQTQ